MTALGNFTLAPGQHYLVGESGNANGVSPLPAPDASGSVAMSATAGKVALVNTAAALNGACPNSAAVVDLVGYGPSANCFETAAAPAPGATTAAVRKGEGCADSGNNAADFTAAQPNPRNSASATHACAAAQAKTGESLPEAGRTLPSFFLTLFGAASAEPFADAVGQMLFPAALCAPYAAALSESRPSEGSTRWRRGVWACDPRGTRGGRPRPPGAWP